MLRSARYTTLSFKGIIRPDGLFVCGGGEKCGDDSGLGSPLPASRWVRPCAWPGAGSGAGRREWAAGRRGWERNWDRRGGRSLVSSVKLPGIIRQYKLKKTRPVI